MPLDIKVGLGPGHIVLDGDPVETQPSPLFGPCLLWTNGRPSQQLLSSCYQENDNVYLGRSGQFDTFSDACQIFA